jgi:hypothetical protein
MSNKRKTPVVVIDNSLEQYKNQPLFQEKADKANGTPDIV